LKYENNSIVSSATLGQTYSAPDYAAQRIPGSGVEPVQKVVETILNHVMGGTVVKPDVLKVLIRSLELLSFFLSFADSVVYRV
jgi:hypothetical protein